MAKRWTDKDVASIMQKAKTGKAKPVISANALTAQAIRLLSMNNFHVWRQNNGGVYDPTKKVFRRNSSTPGISDILGYCKKTARIIAVEVKAGNDKLSPEQIRFLEDIKKAGGIAIELRSIDQIIELIKQRRNVTASKGDSGN